MSHKGRQLCELSEQSGKVIDISPLVNLLYSLLSAHVTPDALEKLVQELPPLGMEVQYTNGWLAKYAQNLAERITQSPLAAPVTGHFRPCPACTTTRPYYVDSGTKKCTVCHGSGRIVA